MRVPARHGAEHAERRGDGVAPALDRELDDVRGVEVVGVLRERRAGRVLDALVDGQDRQVAGAGEAAVADPGIDFAGVLNDRSRPFLRRVLASYGPGLEPDAELRAELLKWMFLFWLGTVGPILALLWPLATR